MKKVNLNILLFLAFIAVFTILNMLQAKRPTVSELENRNLKTMPSFSLNALTRGTYFKDLDEYFSDTFVMRENLVRIAKDIQEYKGFTDENGAELVPYNNNMAEAQNDPNAGSVPEGNVDEDFSAMTEQEDVEASSSPIPSGDTALPSKTPSDIETATPYPSESAPPPSVTPEPTPAASSTPEPSATPEASAQPADPEPKKVGGILIANGRGMETHYFSETYCKNYANTVNRFQEKLDAGVKVYSLLAPVAIEFYNVDKFKDITSPQDKTIATVNGYFNGNIIPVDAYTPISEHTDQYLYFRTDHHWTALGAYYAYIGFMKTLGEEPASLDKYQTAKVEGFLGSTYQSTLSRTLEANPDTITIYKPFTPHEYTVYYDGPVKLNLIDMNRAKDKNKYRVFMSGDRPWSLIKTDVKNGRKIVIIKDSYGNAFIPFLLPHFEEIYTVDPRQYKGNILKLIKDKGIQNVLFLNYVNAIGLQSFLDLIDQMTTR